MGISRESGKGTGVSARLARGCHRGDFATATSPLVPAVEDIMDHVTRRRFMIGGTAVMTALGLAPRTSAQPASASAGPAAPALIEDLVAASRILADQGVLDG
jgi:hypothetical protein